MAKKPIVEEKNTNEAVPVINVPNVAPVAQPTLDEAGAPPNPFEGEGETAPVNDTASAAFGAAAPALGEAPVNPFDPKAHPQKSQEELDAEKKAAADQKAKDKADEKARKEAEKQKKAEAKRAEKEQKKAAKEADKQPLQNDVRRPKPDTKCGQLWALYDKLSNDRGSCCAISDALKIARERGFNDSTIRTQYAAFRRYHGVTGRIEAVSAVGKPAETPAADATTEAPAPQSADQVAATLGQSLGEALGEQA